MKSKSWCIFNEIKNEDSLSGTTGHSLHGINQVETYLSYKMSFKYTPGHSSSPQGIASNDPPLQSSLFPELHILTLSLTPPPHEAVQRDQSLHKLHSTIKDTNYTFQRS